MNSLEVENLSVKVGGKKILDDINLHVPEGETSILFGPNGSGKTTLLMTIAGLPDYKVTKGIIRLNGKDITNIDVDERAKLGLGVGFQLPPEIIGVKLKDMIKICVGKKPDEELGKRENELIDKFNLRNFVDRDINLGFSGGEKKRAEILQLLAMKPRMLLLDEPDSGVDVESLKLITKELRKYLDESKASAVIITHHGDILDYLNAESACVMVDGGVWCRGKPETIYKEILERGYRKCADCHDRHPEEDLK